MSALTTSADVAEQLRAVLEAAKGNPSLLSDPTVQPLVKELGELSLGAPPPADDTANTSASEPTPTHPTETASSASAPAPALPLARGCYLVSEEENGGTLYSIWSEKPVDNAIAYCEPRKNVPKFKFNANGGKTELVRGMRGPLVKNYYAGWLEFVKLTRDFDGTLLMLPGANDLSIHMNFKDHTVTQITVNTPTRFENVRAVVATAKDTLTFSVTSMIQSMFVNKGNSEGACVTFN